MTTFATPIDPTLTFAGARPDDLTGREQDVIRMITRGLTNQEIASELYLSINSVKTYVRSAYRKIGASHRSHAVIWGVRNGFLPVSTSA